MKKVLVSIASLALVFGIMSCASTGTEESDDLAMPEDMAMFQSEDTGLPYVSTGEKLTNDSCNTLSSIAPVEIVVDKDVSKDPAVEVQGASVEVVELFGEKCLKVTPNYNPEIRIAFLFKEPVSAANLKTIKFSVCGFDGGAGAYNCGLMYKEMNGAEHNASFYLSDISSEYWTDFTGDLVLDEQWGNKFNAEKEIIAIQFWSGDKGPLFIKGISLE